MVKKFLSATLFGFLMLGSAGMFVACDDYDDTDLRMRVEAVEGSLADLQAQIENGAVIQSVTPSADGITITMMDGTTYNITNGKDGADGATGADGKPGSVVEIGENGNWFIDGVDTGMPSRGADGQDGQDGADGQDGTTPTIEIIDGYWWINGANTNVPATGANGADGEDGTEITIGENGNWFLDGVDSGVKAQGPQGPQGPAGEEGAQGPEGPQGPAGEDANLVYYFPGEDGYWYKVVCTPDEVEVSRDKTQATWLPEGTITAVYDTESQVLALYNVKGGEGENNVIRIKLSEPLVGLLFVPDALKEGVGVTTYYSLSVETTPGNYKFLASSDLVMDYRMNPSNADLTNLKDKAAWSFVNRTVTVRSADDQADLLEIKGVEFENGKATVTAVTKRQDNSATYDDKDNKEILVALQATDKTQSGSERVITSDYSIIDFQTLNDFRIAKKHELPISSETQRYYPETWSGNVTDATASDYSFVYTKQCNLNALAEAWATSYAHISLVEAGFEEYLTYTFEETKIKGSDGTEQDYYTSISENEDGEYVMTVDNGPNGTPTEAAIGRKPVVKVSAFINGTQIATGYIVIEVRRTPDVVLPVYNVPDKNIEIEYTTLADANSWTKGYAFDWATVNDEIYKALGIPAEDFSKLYDYSNVSFNTATGVNVVINPFNSDPTLTDGLVEVSFNDQVNIPTGSMSSNGTIKVTIPAVDNTANRDIVITINYTVNDKCVAPDFNPQYVSNGTQVVRGTLDSNTGKWIMQTTLSEAYIDYLEGYGYGNHTYEFELAPNAPAGVTITDAATAGGFQKQTIQLTTELGTNEVRRVPVRLVAKRDNGSEHYFNHIVEFRSPIAVIVNEGQPFVLETPLALPQTEDVAEDVDVSLIVGNVLLWDNKAVTANAALYGLTTNDFIFSYAIKAGEDQNGRLTIDKTTGMLTWDNDGTELREDITAHVIVTLRIPNIGTMEVEVPVILKATQGV